MKLSNLLSIKCSFTILSLIAIVMLSSCTKVYTCTCGGVVVEEYKGLTNSERDFAKAICERTFGCIWN